jgi:hypothetical protein
MAGILSAATEREASAVISEIEDDIGAEIVVYTQYKPGSDEASTRLDAIALIEQWSLGDDSLAVLWNTNRTPCIPDESGNGQIQLFAAPAFVARISDADRQLIFDEDMLPLLRVCDEDGALLAALESVDEELGPGPTPTPGVQTAACTDAAYTFGEPRWSGSFEWYFNVSSVPAQYDPDEVLGVLKKSFGNITGARNDCGLPDEVIANSTYLGLTEEEPCGETTDRNVLGFGAIPGPRSQDTLAEMCPYSTEDGSTRYAHIIISSDVSWALSLEACKGGEEVLESTVTHEVGHAFGLGHVGERNHGDLTMSTRSNGSCHNEEATLGLGDILGLEELYGTN